LSIAKANVTLPSYSPKKKKLVASSYFVKQNPIIQIATYN